MCKVALVWFVIGMFGCTWPTWFDDGHHDAGDGGTEEPPLVRDQPWMRIRVTRLQGSTWTLNDEGDVFLAREEAPVQSTAGEALLVAYHGDVAVDATIVRLPQEMLLDMQAETPPKSVSFRGRDAFLLLSKTKKFDRVVLSNASADLATLSVQEDKAATASAMRALPKHDAPYPALQVLSPVDQDTLPREVPAQIGNLIRPTEDHLHMFYAAMGTATPLATTCIRRIGFASKHPELRDGGISDAGARSSRGGEPVTALLLGTTLLLNVDDPAWQEYREDPNLLARLIQRQLVFAYAFLAGGRSKQTVATIADVDAIDAELAKHVRAGVNAMVGPDEGFEDAWQKLQESAVTAKIAAPYTASSVQLTQQSALEGGFATPRGAVGVLVDVAEYVSWTQVPADWKGPNVCTEARNADLLRLSPRLALPVAKEEVLRALGLVDEHAYTNCLGVLAVTSAPGIQLVKADGSSVAFRNGVEGHRVTYLHGEHRDAVVASDGDWTGMVQLTEEAGVGPGGLHVLVPVSQRPSREGIAGVFLSKPLDYIAQSTVSGFAVVTRADTKVLSGRLLLLTFHKPVLGSISFPIGTFRADSPVEDAQIGDQQ